MTDSDRERVVDWARNLLQRADWVILDTETTGTFNHDEIVQVAILSYDAEVLLNTLVRPTQPIPLDATAIHGITNEDVKNAPLFPEVYEKIEKIIGGKTIVVYNAQFDLRLIRQSLAKHGLLPIGLNLDQVDCAMLMYSAWVGELWPYGGYKWQKLESGDHTALGDCRATLELIKKMARA
ncbi:MAG: 3'-5' exonuclease [Candidatus Aminicenantes bacterium]|jgi:DNA polymerase-3 subunit epsilon